jgi:hypothetical protein
VGDIAEDVGEIQTDVDELQEDIEEIQVDVSDIQKDTINKHYFVGIVIMIDNATTNPNTLYNWQTWVRVDGGFVGMYKSGDANFGTAGAAVTGGSKTKNMEHNHVVPAVPAYCQPAGSPGYPMWGTPTGKALSTTQDVLNPGWVLCFWRRTA